MKFDRYFPVMYEQQKEYLFPQEVFEKELDRVTGGRLPVIEDILRSPDLTRIGLQTAAHNAIDEKRPINPSQKALILNDPSVHQPWHLMCWRRTGRTLYDVDEQLARAFLDTDLRVTGEDIRLPMDHFYIAVPKELDLKIYNHKTGWHLLDGFFVADTSVPDGKFAALGDESMYKDAAYFKEAWYQKQFIMMAIGLPRPGMKLWDDALVSFTIPMSIDIEYEKWISLLGEDKLWKQGLHSNLENVRLWTRLILNTILYLSSEKPDAEKQRLGPTAEQKKKAREGSKKSKRELDDATLPVRFIKIGHRLPRDVNVPQDEAERLLSVRFKVRGHWRNQAFGEGRLERKLIWIRPFWKGPEWAEIIKARVAKVTT